MQKLSAVNCSSLGLKALKLQQLTETEYEGAVNTEVLLSSSHFVLWHLLTAVPPNKYLLSTVSVSTLSYFELAPAVSVLLCY